MTEVLMVRPAELAWEQGLRGHDAVHPAGARVWQDVMGEAGDGGDLRLAAPGRGLGNGSDRLARKPQIDEHVVTALLNAKVLDRAEGVEIVFPYEVVKVEFLLHAA